MELQFVKASNNDLDFLLRLRKQTMVEYLESSNLFLTDQQHLSRIKDNFNDCHLLKDQENTSVGMLKYREYPDKFYVFQLQIAPEHQGKGLGGKIILRVIDEAHGKPVELSVLKSNPAIKLYQRLGFKQYKEDDYEFYLRYE